MDMVTTDEDVKMEDQILMFYSSHAVTSLFIFFSSSVMHYMPYTLIAVIILRYSSHRLVLETVQVLSSML